ncbi:MAG: nicotinate-nucleotide diphosphorylase (carboxylating) [Fusobacteriia bacterium 4572_132]|nr:MAG: nicotinate-nucleotide diphosphorylase (carboxylating) [Fusobacteriia bacterium 4572_132]
MLKRGERILSLYVDKFIKMALEEDLGLLGDITTDNLFNDRDYSEAYMNFREKSVISGVEIAKRVFEILDTDIKFQILKKDGEIAKKGENIVKISGKTKAILKGERLALNIMQRMSGIATNSKRYMQKMEGLSTRIADTRKTTPLFRYFEKLAVKHGGGSNHRFALYDAVMIKDNHILAAGSITDAVETIRRNISHTTKIEVEVENLEQAKEALAVKADIIMLDNIRGEKLAECVKLLKGKAIIEASGNINLNNLEEIAKKGVDVISTGAIIYSADNIDIGMDFI